MDRDQGMVLVKHGNRTCCSWFGVAVILVIVVIRLVIGSKTREGMLFGDYNGNNWGL